MSETGMVTAGMMVARQSWEEEEDDDDDDNNRLRDGSDDLVDDSPMTRVVSTAMIPLVQVDRIFRALRDGAAALSTSRGSRGEVTEYRLRWPDHRESPCLKSRSVL